MLHDHLLGADLLVNNYELCNPILYKGVFMKSTVSVYSVVHNFYTLIYIINRPFVSFYDIRRQRQ